MGTEYPPYPFAKPATSNSSDIPRYDRLTQERDGRLRFADWYYGPQFRLMASYKFKDKRATRLYDDLTFTTAYQRIKESRHDRSSIALGWSISGKTLQ